MKSHAIKDGRKFPKRHRGAEVEQKNQARRKSKRVKETETSKIAKEHNPTTVTNSDWAALV
jgi:hypothetical protein